MSVVRAPQAPDSLMDSWKLTVAPMMDWTDRHCRFFHRLLAPKARLYTEMVTAQAVKHGVRDILLGYNPEEHPVALQLGGSDPKLLAEAAIAGKEYGYDEINLNCGCPSDRVQQGSFGACLMAEPELVTACVTAMHEAVKGAIPITVKCRIAIDEYEPDPFLHRFINIVSTAGCDLFIIHARKAWLKGLSPKENREIPPLDYDLPACIKQEYPNLTILLNGGIANLETINATLPKFDGLMIGRAAYQHPDFLRDAHTSIYGTPPIADAFLIESMAEYMDKTGLTRQVTRHMVGLFAGQKGARQWRQDLSEIDPNAKGDGLRRAYARFTQNK